MTMSISVAPSARACRVSATLVSVVAYPCGKPTTVPTLTSLPASIAAARRTWMGGTQTLATSYSAATRMPSSTNASSSSGRRSEWSMVLAMSRSVRVSMDSVTSVT
jgi:hypothetical protein